MGVARQRVNEFSWRKFQDMEKRCQSTKCCCARRVWVTPGSREYKQSAVSSQCQLDRYSCILEKYLEQALRGVWSSNCSLLTCGDTGLYCIGKIR
ncbi:hypothetical protein AV530_019679 [Patagioenas fasciata monilis]|uniref:Uncharacterized protein n=1 Tax=Patagioenas fasciata monilis TaxID=372326 RepID=A0A1V4JFL2_PATFA|nr:hypothetical protein AV530_019679 [Patagioenas fasciata monilis]